MNTLGLITALLLIVLSVAPSAYGQNPIIKTTDSNNCYQPGAPIRVYGKNFGNPKTRQLVFAKDSQVLPASVIKQWSAELIIANLPTAVTPGARYIIGIRDSQHWISNRDRSISICSNQLVTRTQSFTSNPSEPGREDTKTVNPAAPASEIIRSISIDPDPIAPGADNNPNSTIAIAQLGVPPTAEPAIKNAATKEQTREPGEAIIISSSMAAAMALAKRLGPYNISIKRRVAYQGLGIVITTLNIPEPQNPAEVIQQLRNDFPELWIDFNHRYQLLESSNPKHWGFDHTGWSDQTRGCGDHIAIGIIDTGVAAELPFHQDRLTQKSLLPAGVPPAKGDHGTAVASLILGDPKANIPGLAPKAQLYSAAVFRTRDKNTTDTTAELIIAGLNWLSEQPLRVINLSLGGPRNLGVELALDRLLKKDFIIVAAAGVDNEQQPLFPAAQPGIYAVTAIDANNQLFSKNISGDYIDFAAPGADLWLTTANGRNKYLSGSSFATPFIAVAAAVLTTQQKPLSVALKEHSKDLGETGKDPWFGWGMLEVSELSCS